MKDLLAFAKEGLRTLVLAQKKMQDKDYYEFSQRFQKYKTMISDDKDEKLNELFDEYEKNFDYAGSTAIEDKLQYGVPETIAKLMEASIKVWVLTGDKQETAIEIGKSCRLIQEDMQLEILSSENEEEFREKFLDLVGKYQVNLAVKVKDLRKLERDKRDKKRVCIVVDGPTLVFIMKEEYTADAFFQLGLIASSVICCRVSPK